MPGDRYHHGRLREALVDATVALARESGPDGVVIREAARRVGVSHNAAYRHFADRDALLRAVGMEGLGLLVAAMRQREREVTRLTAGAEDDRDLASRQLRAIGKGYVDFALSEPGMFDLVFHAYPDAGVGLEETAAGEPDPLGVLTTALDRLAAAGGIHPAHRGSAESLCWSAVHGFAELHLHGPLRGSDPQQREAELDRLIDTIEIGLRTPPTAR